MPRHEYVGLSCFDGASVSSVATDDAAVEPSLPLTAIEAGDELFDYLVALKREGTLAAAHVCAIAYWAKDAGAVGQVHILAVNPESKGRNCSRKFAKAVGAEHMAAEHYVLPVPGFRHQ